MLGSVLAYCLGLLENLSILHFTCTCRFSFGLLSANVLVQVLRPLKFFFEDWLSAYRNLQLLAHFPPSIAEKCHVFYCICILDFIFSVYLRKIKLEITVTDIS